MSDPKHRMPRTPGPRHPARLRLSFVVRMLELERAELGQDAEQHEWWRRREERLLLTGRR